MLALFENDVKMYGTQTTGTTLQQAKTFENDVKMYGTQTSKRFNSAAVCLRMM